MEGVGPLSQALNAKQNAAIVQRRFE